MEQVKPSILVVNPGSSTIKYVLFEEGAAILEVTYDKEHDGCTRRVTSSGNESREHLTTEEFLHTEKDMVALLEGMQLAADVSHLAFRVVHGGFSLTEVSLIDEGVLQKIREASSLAPLHNPVCIKLIEAWQGVWPTKNQYAVFDTAFHATIPEYIYTYALPKELRETSGIRRYGFHGISYASMVRQLTLQLGYTPKRIIACHLGSGASICAIKNGESFDTSMGTTPLEGLMMGTRVGDIDPGSVLLLEEFLAETTYADKGEDAQEEAHEAMEEILYKHSGLLGVAGTHDMREVLKRDLEGNTDATLALDMFCYHIQKYIGSYYAILGGCDAIIFGGGIGQGSAAVRARILEPLQHLGFVLDDAKNNASKVSSSIENQAESTASIWIFDPEEARQIYAEVSKKVVRKKA